MAVLRLRKRRLCSDVAQLAALRTEQSVGRLISFLNRGVSMKIVHRVIFAAFIFTAASAQTQDAEKVAGAHTAALKWLALTDAGDYARGWDAASALFQASISKSNWDAALVNSRQPLGRLLSRKLKSASYTRSLPGVPD